MHSFPSVLIIADIPNSDLEQKYIQEWEDLESVLKIQSALEGLGERVEIVESPSILLQKLSEYSEYPFNERPVLFHLVEGFLSRNREALLPAIAEYFGFPHTGSDAYAQNLSLDKHNSKLLAQSLGVPTASWGIWEVDSVVVPTKNGNSETESNLSQTTGLFLGERLPSESEFQVFCKPRFEGSSLGVGEENLLSDQSSLLQFLSSKVNEHSSWIWETYLPGEEWTVAVIGSPKSGYKISSVARIGLEHSEETVYGEITKTKASMPETVHFDLEERRSDLIQKYSLELCRSVGISGAARLDWKGDTKGEPHFLEWNLTPGLSPYYSTYPICFSKNLGTYGDLLSELIRIARLEFQTERFLYSKLKKENSRLPL